MVKFVFCTITLLAFISCQNKNANTMEFNINPNLLGKEVIDTAFSIKFNPPKNWKEISDIAEIKEKRSNFSTTNQFLSNLKVKYLFMDKDSMSVLSVLNIENINKSELDSIDILFSELTEITNQGKVKKECFIYNGFDICQYIIQSKDNILMSLLFKIGNQPIYQVNYVVPVNKYISEIRNIESSIGSFSLSD